MYCAPYLLFYWKFVRPVTQRHECAFERMAIDFAPDLDQAASSKKVHRFRPHDKCPSAFGSTFLQFGGEEFGQLVVIFFSRGHDIFSLHSSVCRTTEPGIDMLQKNFFIVGHLRVAESTGTPDTRVWSISLERVDVPTWTQGGQLEVDARGMHVNGLRQRQPLLNLSRRL